MKKFILFIFCVALLMPGDVSAQEPATLESQVRELTQMVRDLKQVVDRQQAEILELKAASAPPVATQTVPGPSAGRPWISSRQGRWNQEIGVVGDVVFLSD